MYTGRQWQLVPDQLVCINQYKSKKWPLKSLNTCLSTTLIKSRKEMIMRFIYSYTSIDDGVRSIFYNWKWKNVIKRSKIRRRSPERQIRVAVQPIRMTGNRLFLTGTQKEAIVNYAKWHEAKIKEKCTYIAACRILGFWTPPLLCCGPYLRHFVWWQQTGI